jgi:phosphoribosylcarboxyaminoimidazole (NCAIR) mutase
MEEWLSGVTRLVDVDDLPQGVPGASVEMFRGIDSTLRILINQMQKNNQAMAALLRQQQKNEPDAASESTPDRS